MVCDKATGTFNVNGILINADGDVRIHPIEDNKIKDRWLILHSCSIPINPGLVIFINHRWDNTHVDIRILSIIDFEEDIGKIFNEKEFKETLAYILHRLEESYLINLA